MYLAAARLAVVLAGGLGAGRRRDRRASCGGRCARSSGRGRPCARRGLSRGALCSTGGSGGRWRGAWDSTGTRAGGIPAHRRSARTRWPIGACLAGANGTGAHLDHLCQGGPERLVMVVRRGKHGAGGGADDRRAGEHRHQIAPGVPHLALRSSQREYGTEDVRDRSAPRPPVPTFRRAPISRDRARSDRICRVSSVSRHYRSTVAAHGDRAVGGQAEVAGRVGRVVRQRDEQGLAPAGHARAAGAAQGTARDEVGRVVEVAGSLARAAPRGPRPAALRQVGLVGEAEAHARCWMPSSS